MSLCPEMLTLFWREFSTVCGDFKPEGIEQIQDYENFLLDTDTELKFDKFVWSLVSNSDDTPLTCLQNIVFFVSRQLNWVHEGKGWDFDVVYTMFMQCVEYAKRLEKEL